MTGTSILDLPSSVRYRIYHFTEGLSRPCPISLTTRLASIRERGPRYMHYCTYNRIKTQGSSNWGRQTPYGCFCPLIPTSIFRVCRLIYIETLIYFYTSNKFKLLGQKASDLEILWKLPRLALFSMTSLLVRLNCWPCPHGHDEITKARKICDICHSWLESADDLLTEGKDISTLQTWERLCNHLARNIKPNQLSLTLICDTAEQSVAERICHSLTCLQLKNCTIRLGRAPSDAFNTLARVTALKQTQRYVPQGTFPFFRLPAEIRFRILGYTHLSPLNGFDSQFHNLTIARNHIHAAGSYAGTQCTRPKPRRCCHDCTDTADSCCCLGIRAAFSETCSCRVIPLELCLVSRQMKQEAEYVLFSSNCLHFFDQDPLQTMVYLHQHLRCYLWSLCCIRFTFSYRQIVDWEIRTHVQWCVLIKFIKDNLHIQKLCIVINTESNWDDCLFSDSYHQRLCVYNAYCELALELLTLHGLKDMLLEFGWFTPLEKLLEQEVMGNNYEGYHGIGRSNRVMPLNPMSRSNRLPIWHASAWEEVTRKFYNSVSYKSSSSIGTHSGT